MWEFVGAGDLEGDWIFQRNGPSRGSCSTDFSTPLDTPHDLCYSLGNASKRPVAPVKLPREPPSGGRGRADRRCELPRGAAPLNRLRAAVGADGCARYCAGVPYSIRSAPRGPDKPEVVPQFNALCSQKGTEGIFI